MRARRTAAATVGVDDPDHDDPEVVNRASAGDLGAFDELYRRHSPAAWRVAHAVTGNPDDASDAVAEAFVRVLQAVSAGRLDDPSRFRPYLLTATRNAAIDGLRRSGRLRPTDLSETLATKAAPRSGPSERAVEVLDATLVAAAFRSLPERWRSVLWLTEVEGIPPREAAAMLGVSANGAAQLAVRARAGLRERFLQAHLQGSVEEECRYTVERLGAYVGGGLAAREIAKVDQHLAGCGPCRARRAELEELGTSLRRIALPIPLMLGALALNRWKLAASLTASVTKQPSKGLAGMLQSAQRPLMAVSLGMASLGIVAAAVVGQRVPNEPVSGKVAAPGAASSPETASSTPISSPPAVDFRNADLSTPVPAATPAVTADPVTITPGDAPAQDPAAASAPAAPPPAVAAPPSAPVAAAPPAPAPPPPTTQQSPPPVAVVGTAVIVGPVQTAASATVTSTCAGVATSPTGTNSSSVPGTSTDCSTPPPSTTTTSTSTSPVSATVSTGGSALGTTSITVP